MADVRVSNARRISFTALAVVSFWVLAWRAYWMGCDEVFDSAFARLWGYRQSITSVSFALVPAILLSLSVYNFPLMLRDRWTLTLTILLSVTMSVCYGFGECDAEVTFESVSDSVFQELAPTLDGSSPLFVPRDRCIQAHETPWLWLLLPITLASAFVIFGAWRRAVRDAEVEAVGEDE